MLDCYRFLDKQGLELTRSDAGFNSLITAEPHTLDDAIWESFQRRYKIIKEWQATTLALFQQSLLSQIESDVADLILADLPPHLGAAHHHSLISTPPTTPVFFRTDEVTPGVLTEVQCPGSMWGTHEQLYDYYTVTGALPTSWTEEPLSRRFAAGLERYLGRRPVIHHLLDNSSNPAAERYFIQKARRYIDYYGYDKGVRPLDCNFIRAHDFFALMAENHTQARLAAWRDDGLRYDLPPWVLFDKKIGIAFPFWEKTRAYYSDAVRQLFPYTQLVTPEGFFLEDGSWAKIDEFCALPRSARRYFLKYAGADVGRNWGGKAVFNLSKLSHEACQIRFDAVLGEYRQGHHWIIQKAHTSTTTVDYMAPGNEVRRMSAHAKLSGFYGPTGLMGILLMYERFYKVHGSKETVMTIAR